MKGKKANINNSKLRSKAGPVKINERGSNSFRSRLSEFFSLINKLKKDILHAATKLFLSIAFPYSKKNTPPHSGGDSFLYIELHRSDRNLCQNQSPSSKKRTCFFLSDSKQASIIFITLSTSSSFTVCSSLPSMARQKFL